MCALTGAVITPCACSKPLNRRLTSSAAAILVDTFMVPSFIHLVYMPVPFLAHRQALPSRINRDCLDMVSKVSRLCHVFTWLAYNWSDDYLDRRRMPAAGRCCFVCL